MAKSKNKSAPKHTILPKKTLPSALGLLSTNQPAPADEEIQRWLDERRMKKYGAGIACPLLDPPLQFRSQV